MHEEVVAERETALSRPEAATEPAPAVVKLILVALVALQVAWSAALILALASIIG